MGDVRAKGEVSEVPRDKGGAYREDERRDDAIVDNVNREVMDFPVDATRPCRILRRISVPGEIVRRGRWIRRVVRWRRLCP